MFDHKITQITNREEKRNAIEDALRAAHEAGTLTYTDVMLNSRELVTFAFEVMDGIKVDSNNVVAYQQGDRIDLGPVRLVSIADQCYVDHDHQKQPEKCVLEPYRIRLSRWHQPRIPGTSTKTRNRVKRMIEYGTDVTLDDRLEDERPARRLLWEHGYPVCQFRSRTQEVGSIIEMKWLERIAASGDAEQEYRDILARIKAREAAAKSESKTKSAPATGRSQEQRP